MLVGYGLQFILLSLNGWFVMIDIKVKCNRVQYEKRLCDHLHNCSGIEAIERHQHLMSRSGADRFDYIYKLRYKPIQQILENHHPRPWNKES